MSDLTYTLVLHPEFVSGPNSTSAVVSAGTVIVNSATSGGLVGVTEAGKSPGCVASDLLALPFFAVSQERVLTCSPKRVVSARNRRPVRDPNRFQRHARRVPW